MFSFNPPSLHACGSTISLDRGGENVFLSHAHSDHAPKKCLNVIASLQTIDLFQARTNKKISLNPFSCDELKLELLDAGHVLGSKMLYAKWDSTSFLYSGDFKTRDSLTAKAAVPKHAETLVIEATYALPQATFPDRQQTYEQIASWTEKNQEKGIVLLAGYVLGKSQELVKCLNEYAGITPITPNEISAINDVYCKHGVELDFLPTNSEEANEELNSNFVAVVPPNALRKGLAQKLSSHYKKRVFTAFATGWSVFHSFNSFDETFCLSDHADYPDLIAFVEACQPKKVFCVHGYAKEFARDLRAKGFNAVAEKEEEQTLLACVV